MKGERVPTILITEDFENRFDRAELQKSMAELAASRSRNLREA